MELKRALTKRMRIRKNNSPGTIELPAREVQPDLSPVTSAHGFAAPMTPTTPGIEEFVSIAFEDQPRFSSPSSRSVRPTAAASARSSRSASLASNFEDVTSSPVAAPISTTILTSAESEPQPVTPTSMHDEHESDADEMAQHILNKVQEGGQNWAL